MAEYIDREALLELINEDCKYKHPTNEYTRGCNDVCEWAIRTIENIPTADVVPKSEVENIFAEIETCMKDFEDDDDGYLLKKCEFEFFMREIKEKYAGQKNG